MRIIIIGAGQVGYNIAAHLAAEHQDVVVLDSDEHALRHVSDTLDVQPVPGSGSSPSALLDAGIEHASLLIAVTDSDEVNMIACMVASARGRKEMVKVARVRSREFFQDDRLRERLSRFIDLPINPERVAADIVLDVLSVPAVNAVFSFDEGRVQVLGIPVVVGSPIDGCMMMDLADMDPQRRLLVAAIRRGGEIIVPKGTDSVHGGDTVYAVATPDGRDHIVGLCGHQATPLRRVMIAGTTPVARAVAGGLGRIGVQVKIIEPDDARAEDVARRLDKAVVLQGDATDSDLLREEFVQDMDAFFAATDDEEKNILSALLAKRLGVRRTIALTDKASYMELIRQLGVDVVVSPRLAAVSSILQFVRRGRVLSAAAFGDEAEVVEFEAAAGSPIVGKPIRKVRFPAGAIIGAIVRDGNTVVPSGDDEVQPGDHVVVFALKAAISDVEGVFAQRPL